MRAAAVLAAVVLVAGCAEPPKKSTYSERVILLPNRDGRASALVVQRAGSEQQLKAPYQGIEVAGGADKPFVSSAQAVEQRYGEMLTMQPARPLTFTLNFNLGTTDLTSRSRALLDEVKQRIASFPAARVTVTGHTDTSGTTELNDALSLSRAVSVRDVLIRLGIPASAIDVVGRGSRELLVRTGPGVREERNRRVEVRLR